MLSEGVAERNCAQMCKKLNISSDGPYCRGSKCGKSFHFSSNNRGPGALAMGMGF